MPPSRNPCGTRPATTNRCADQRHALHTPGTSRSRACARGSLCRQSGYPPRRPHPASPAGPPPAAPAKAAKRRNAEDRLQRTCVERPHSKFACPWGVRTIARAQNRDDLAVNSCGQLRRSTRGQPGLVMDVGTGVQNAVSRLGFGRELVAAARPGRRSCAAGARIERRSSAGCG